MDNAAKPLIALARSTVQSNQIICVHASNPLGLACSVGKKDSTPDKPGSFSEFIKKDLVNSLVVNGLTIQKPTTVSYDERGLLVSGEVSVKINFSKNLIYNFKSNGVSNGFNIADPSTEVDITAVTGADSNGDALQKVDALNADMISKIKTAVKDVSPGSINTLIDVSVDFKDKSVRFHADNMVGNTSLGIEVKKIVGSIQFIKIKTFNALLYSFHADAGEAMSINSKNAAFSPASADASGLLILGASTADAAELKEIQPLCSGYKFNLALDPTVVNSTSVKRN